MGGESEGYSSVFNMFLNWFDFLGNGQIVFVFLIISIQALILAQITNTKKIFGKNTFIAGIVFLILTSPTSLHSLNPILLANLFIVWAFSTMIKLIPKKKSPYDFYRVGLLMAVATIFYPQYILLILFSVIAQIIIRSKVSKELFAVVLGFITVYLLYNEINYLAVGEMFRFDVFWQIISGESAKFSFSWTMLTFIIIIGVLFLISNAYIIQNVGYKEIENRTVFQLNFAFFIFATITYLLIPSTTIDIWLTFAIQLTFLIGDFFTNLKPNFFNKLLFIVFLLSGFIFYLESMF